MTTNTTWKKTLKRGDVVAFRFPHQREGENDPKVRPTLVLDVEDRFGELFAWLAYGTTKGMPKKLRGYAIKVELEGEVEAASLKEPTWFNSTRRLLVSLNHPGFDVNPASGTAVLGQLTGWSADRMNDVRARIHAERDIRRAQLHRRRRNQPREVTIERRRNGKLLATELRHV